jgi:plastocyanin
VVVSLLSSVDLANADTVIVDAKSNFFSPSEVTIKTGDTVRWVFDQGVHTTTSSNGLWDSGILGSGKTFDYTFNNPGDFDYVCTLHVDCCGMQGTVHVMPPAATPKLLVSAPTNVTAGVPFNVTVTTMDANGNIVQGYTGTVAFTSSDPAPAMLPANYTFTSADQGTHAFAGVTFFTFGTQTLTVQDTANGLVTGSATVTVGTPSPARLVIAALPGAFAGTALDLTVTAVDDAGNAASSYTGTVTFTSSDAFPGLLPADYTFSATDQGSHTFSGGATFFTAGSQTITAQDTATGSIIGSATIAVAAAPANRLLVTAPSNAVSGTGFDVVLMALDPYGNVDMNYAGTVTWATSDADLGVSLPPDYPFQAADSGVHLFANGVTLVTVGDQTLTASDTVGGIVGSATVTVGPAP